ncbi:MAG: hypothetical protein E7293_09690 [Lachnospiraceae bacterium]|nr:hypothetical protein [Lachnospiraceae bacterium]
MKKKSFRYALIISLAILLVSTAFLLLEMWEKRQGEFSAAGFLDTTMEYKGQEYVLKDNVETFLVLGLDKFEGVLTNDSYNNDQQADFLLLLVFDNEKKQCEAIQINRDTMANMSVLGVAGQKIDTVNKQIALAHTYGNGKEVSCRNTADAVSELLLGVNIDHYISLTMDAVPVLNDLVGGVEVTLLEDFTDVDAAMVKGKTVTLKGEQALHYVRTRYGLEDSSNSARMERQKQYIQALYEQSMQRVSQDEEFLVEATVKLADHMVSDRSVNRLQELAEKFAAYEFKGVNSIEGELVLGEEFMEFYPNEDAIKETVVNLFYE